MDYDYWLQEGAGCFDEYSDTDECWSVVKHNMWNEFNRYKNIQEFLKESSFGVDTVSELWDKEMEKEEYDNNPQYLVDIWTLSEEYPDYANTFFERIKPKTPEELREFLTDDEIVEYCNNRYGDY